MGERGENGEAWGARGDGASWWPTNRSEHEQQQNENASGAVTNNQPIFTYKMSSGFSNSGDTSNQNYDYRLLTEAVTRANETAMQQHQQQQQQQQQWWYNSATGSDDQSSSPTMEEQESKVNAQRKESQNQQTLQQTLQQHQQQSQQTFQQTLQQQQALQQALQQQVAQTLQQQIQAAQEHQIQAALHQQNLTLEDLQRIQKQCASGGGGGGGRARMPRTRSDGGKPRGRMTAYAFFVQSCREEHKELHPDENVVFTVFSKKCAERWNMMQEQDKQRFHELAEQDKKRYELEMQSYVPPKGITLGRQRRRKQIKDPKAPKRSLSAFFWFCHDERAKVKAKHPEFGMGDVAKELGRRWATLPIEVKTKYEAQSEQDKARYDRELTAYKTAEMPPIPVNQYSELMHEGDMAHQGHEYERNDLSEEM